MQLRKPAIWIATVIPYGLYAVLAMMGTQNLERLTRDTNPKTWMVAALGWFTPLLAMVFGFVLADRLVRDRKLGVAPLLDATPSSRSAREFLDYVALLKGFDDRAHRRRRVAELLELAHLADAADRKLRGYSGGMRRRVGIAQALLNDPELLIVDEPTAGLDPEERIRFRTLLSQLAERRTVVLSTHIVDDVAQTCTELAVLGRGRLIFRGR